ASIDRICEALSGRSLWINRRGCLQQLVLRSVTWLPTVSDMMAIKQRCDLWTEHSDEVRNRDGENIRWPTSLSYLESTTTINACCDHDALWESRHQPPRRRFSILERP